MVSYNVYRTCASIAVDITKIIKIWKVNAIGEWGPNPKTHPNLDLRMKKIGKKYTKRKGNKASILKR